MGIGFLSPSCDLNQDVRIDLLQEIGMVAPLASRQEALDRVFSNPARLTQWRQVCQVNTVEEAEEMIEDLKATGVDAALSMIDGLSVIARRED
jgi:hypothetical protein